MPDLVTRRDEDGIAILALNAPDTLNALSSAMLDALQSAFDAIAADPVIRVVLLRAEGRAFSAGHDLAEMQAARAASDQGLAYFQHLFGRAAHLMQGIAALPQPVIAAVQGTATAAGCQLACSADLIVAGAFRRHRHQSRAVLLHPCSCPCPQDCAYAGVRAARDR
jgi:enoyl-CoA hydratase/carnithine racemase